VGEVRYRRAGHQDRVYRGEDAAFAQRTDDPPDMPGGKEFFRRFKGQDFGSTVYYLLRRHLSEVTQRIMTNYVIIIIAMVRIEYKVDGDRDEAKVCRD